MQTYQQQQAGRPKAVPVQIGTNWTHVHVAMFVATVLSCGLAAPIWLVAGIVHACSRKPTLPNVQQQTHMAPNVQQFQQPTP